MLLNLKLVASAETKYPPEEAPKATRGSDSRLCVCAHHCIIFLTINLSSPNVQHLPALEIVITANLRARAWRTSSLSSGKPMQLGQLEDLSQKLAALPSHPWATKRTAFGKLGICHITSVPFLSSIVGLNCTDSKEFHFFIGYPKEESGLFPLLQNNNINNTSITTRHVTTTGTRQFWSPTKAFNLAPRFAITVNKTINSF